MVPTYYYIHYLPLYLQVISISIEALFAHIAFTPHMAAILLPHKFAWVMELAVVGERRVLGERNSASEKVSLLWKGSIAKVLERRRKQLGFDRLIRRTLSWVVKLFCDVIPNSCAQVIDVRDIRPLFLLPGHNKRKVARLMFIWISTATTKQTRARDKNI